MSKQPEALRLADRLEGRWALHPEMQEAAAELRRQHAEIESLRREQEEDQCAIRVWRRRADQAEAKSDALLEALKLARSIIGHPDDAHSQMIDAAIKAVEEGK